MTALLVITSKHPMPQLRRRIDSYQSNQQAGRYIHYLEVFAAGVITQNGSHIQIGPKWAPDIRSTHTDPTASFACIEMQNREDPQQAITRALQHPARALSSCQINSGGICPQDKGGRAPPPLKKTKPPPNSGGSSFDISLRP